MNVIKITDERIDAILPKSIKDSDVLSNNDKKVLGAILHYFLVLDKAKENKYVILTNEDLRKTVGIRKTDMLSSVQNLIEMKLIQRECGKTRKEGEKAQASKYYVNWNNLKKPLKKQEFEDLFSDFISSETPLGTVDTDIDSDTDTDKEIDIDIDKAPVDDVTEVTLQENNKIKNINMKKSNSVKSHVDNIIQSDDVNNINSVELLIKEKDKTSMTDKFKVVENNDDFFDLIFDEETSGGDMDNNDTKKENEMSDNGTNAMNAISEQSERQAKENESSGCGKENEMATSTSGDKNKTSKGEHNVPVVIPKDKIIPRPAPAPQTQNKATGEPQNVSVDNLSTQGKKTQPEPQECPQIEFNREEMLQLMDMSANETDLDRFKEQLRKMDEYMQWLKLNDRFQYKLYVKEIYSWFKSHTWNMEFDFISLGGEFMRKYVA